MAEQTRRMAAESKIVGMTAERDAYHSECQVLELKLKSMQHELDNAHCQIKQDQGCRGCTTQPQPLLSGNHDSAHSSDAAELNTGQTFPINHLDNNGSMGTGIAHCMFMLSGSMMQMIMPGLRVP